jgi:conjugal transfer/entry exclusion protein
MENQNEIKLPEELLTELQQLRDELTQNVVKIGRLNVQLSFYKKDIEIIEGELSNLYQEAAAISAKEDSIQNKVVSEYGNGKLDFETGIFTKG